MGAFQESAQCRGDVEIVGRDQVRHRRDHVRLGVCIDHVVHEPPVELPADEPGHLVDTVRIGLREYHREHRRELGLAVYAPLDDCVVIVSGEYLVRRVVPRAVEISGLRPYRRIHVLVLAPAGQNMCRRFDVGFRVIGVIPGPGERPFAYGEELLKLAAVVFVRTGFHVVGSVQVDQHRPVLRNGVRHVLEVAEDIVPQERIVPVGVPRVADRAHLRDEMICPEERQLLPYGEPLVQYQSDPPCFERVDPGTRGVDCGVRVEGVHPGGPHGDKLACTCHKRLCGLVRLGGEEEIHGVTRGGCRLQQVHMRL